MVPMKVQIKKTKNIMVEFEMLAIHGPRNDVAITKTKSIMFVMPTAESMIVSYA